MGRLLLFVVLIMSCNVGDIANAQDRASANHRMPGCRSAIAPNDNSNPYMQGVCTGTVDALQFASVDLCAPPESTIGQALRVVVKYIDDRPARMHEDFKILALEAMRAAWPCKRQGSR
jgi:hypothetical protein